MQKFCTYILLLLFLVCVPAYAQAQYEKKSFRGVRTTEKMTIDAKMDEAIWQEAEVLGDFVQLRPNPGKLSERKSEVRMVYDDDAIYILAKLYEKKEDVFNLLTNRDNIGNSDYFGVSIDPFKAGLNGVGLFVTVAGVQYDTRYSGGGNERIWRNDQAWNAVWLSKTAINDDHWVVEYKIPYAVLRFTGSDVQNWGINFVRKSNSLNEDSFWNGIDPELDGYLNQAGEVKDLENIETPTRLFFYPYVSTVLSSSRQTGFVQPQFNAGMDVRYGITDAFTLDMTLIPDFSGVRSDNQVLNLSPFEVRFDEQRQFFTEGVELFNRAGLFYSRRIGQTYGHISDEMGDNEEIVSRPDAAQLLNAFKVTGRSSKGLGIGVFNAITDKTYITVEDTATGNQRDIVGDPLTNYNILVLDQNMKNNSTVTLTNAMVMRGNTADDANISGLNLRLNDKSLTWRLSGFGGYSNVISYEGDNDERNVKSGFKYNLGFAKTRGNFQFNVNSNVESDTYDINDIGFLRRANRIEHQGNVSYNSFRPKGVFNNWRIRLGANYNQLYNPNVFTNMRLNLNIGGQFRNFWFGGLDFSVNPTTSFDYFEPRVNGYYFKRPENGTVSINYRTDSRKNFRTDGRLRVSSRPEWDQIDYGFNHSERIRVGARFELSHRLDLNYRNNERGYVTRLRDDNGDISEIIFGKRDVQNITNTLDSRYIFTNRMGLTFRVRHYWSRVTYKKFYSLQENGDLGNTEYTGLRDDGTARHNRNFNTFNIDMDYNWQISPGSEIRVIWKRSIGTDGNDPTLGFVENLGNTLAADNFDTITIRMVYFIDYLNIKKIFTNP